MSGQEFGQAVNRKIRAMLEWTDQQRRRERIVDDQRRARLLRQFRDQIQIADAQQRIRNRLHHDAAGLRFGDLLLPPPPDRTCRRNPPPRPAAPAPESTRLWWRRRAHSTPAPTCADPSARPATPRESPSSPTTSPARCARIRARSATLPARCAWGCRSGRSRIPALRGPARGPAWPCLRRDKWWRCRWASRKE